MKKILLLSYRICFPIAITAIFLILLPRVLLFFLPFTLGAVLALLSEPLIRLGRKAFPFLKKDQLSVLVILLLFLLFATLLYLLILLGLPFVTKKMAGFPEYLLSIKEMSLETLETLRNFLPESFRGVFLDLPNKMESFGKNLLKNWSAGTSAVFCLNHSFGTVFCEGWRENSRRTQDFGSTQF